MSEVGIKHDQGKLRYELVKPEMLEQLAKALHGGAEKYGDENYKYVDNQRYIGALMRHLQAYRKGELADKDSGLHPMAHVMACAAIILQKDMESRNNMMDVLDSILEEQIKDETRCPFNDEDFDAMEEEEKLRMASVQEYIDNYSGMEELPNWLKSERKKVNIKIDKKKKV